MKSGFRIRWTNHALKELEETFNYINRKFTERELKNLAAEIEKVVKLISLNPEIFPASEMNPMIRKAVVLKLNNLYFRQNKEYIEILSFFSNRQNPNKIKF